MPPNDGGVKRWATEGISPNGTVEGCAIETHYLHPEAVYIVGGADGYVRIILDGPGIDYEARLPLTLADAMIAAREARP